METNEEKLKALDEVFEVLCGTGDPTQWIPDPRECLKPHASLLVSPIQHAICGVLKITPEYLT